MKILTTTAVRSDKDANLLLVIHLRGHRHSFKIFAASWFWSNAERQIYVQTHFWWWRKPQLYWLNYRKYIMFSFYYILLLINFFKVSVFMAFIWSRYRGLSWRSWLARSAVNRKIGGSSPPGSGYVFLYEKMVWPFFVCFKNLFWFLGNFIFFHMM